MENIIVMLFFLMDSFFLLSLVYWCWVVFRRRRTPIFPQTGAVIVGVLYLLFYLPLSFSYDIADSFYSFGPHPYGIFMLILHWPAIQFILWAAYPPGPGRMYFDFPLLSASTIWLGGLFFYFWGAVVVLAIARGISSLINGSNKTLQRTSLTRRR